MYSPAETLRRANKLVNMFNTEDNRNVNVNANNANGNDSGGTFTEEGSGVRKQNATNKVLKYNLFRRNCEHFASTCVNGPGNEELTKDAIKESLSVQARDCVWILISLMFWMIQAIFYGFNFWMYAVFVQKDCDFKFLTDAVAVLNWCCNYCYKDHNNCAVFIPLYTANNCSTSQSSEAIHYDTICDWILIAIFVGFSLILSTIIVLIYRKNKFMCKMCFYSLCINRFFSNTVSMILIEFLNILSEDVLYSAVSRWKLNRFWTVIMLIMVSTFGALCIYSLASVITKLIVLVCSTDRAGFWRCLGCWKCSSDCCKSSCYERYSTRTSHCPSCCSAWQGYAKYVPLRGIVQSFFRNTRSKYLQPRIGEGDALRPKKACLVCRIEIPIYHFDQLEPGDHISMPGAAQFANLLYKHHAIVAKINNVSKDGTEANLEVIDVPHMGKGFCWSEQIPVELHSLFDADRHRLTSSRWVHGYRDVGQRDGDGDACNEREDSNM